MVPNADQGEGDAHQREQGKQASQLQERPAKPNPLEEGECIKTSVPPNKQEHKMGALHNPLPPVVNLWQYLECCYTRYMQLKLEPLSSAHLTAAAELVGRRCQALRRQVPALPAAYEAAETWRPLLSQMIRATAGAAALRQGELAGFLSAWQLPDFRGQPTTYSPEWANAAQADQSRRIYEALYTHMAGRWRDQGYATHIVSALAHDRQELDTWNRLGFGQMAVDALRDLRPAAGSWPAVEIRRAGPAELAEVMRLGEALRQHTAASPIFLQGQRRDAGYYDPWLRESGQVIWLAYQEGRAVAFLQQGPANGDVCEVIVDPGTSSIYGAYTEPQFRSRDIATCLLSQALQWAREQGYQRLAVDFEPMNHWAARFWQRHFQPVVISLSRRLDPAPAGIV